MATEKFLFINKTASSTRLGGSKGAEATAIQRFVHKGKKQAHKKQLVSAFQKSQARTLAEDEPSSTILKIAARTASTLFDEEVEHVTSSLIAHVSSSFNKPSNLELPLTGSHTYRPSIYIVSSVADPFHVTSVQINSDIRSLLHYYTTIYHPTLWPNETQALRRGAYIFEESVNDIVQYSLQDSLAMYCLLASAASRLTYLDKLPSSSIRAQGDNFMKQALNLMQWRIVEQCARSRGSLLYLLQYVIFLSSAEAYRDNFLASRIHLEAGIKLLTAEELTIKDAEPRNLQGMMLMSDLFLSCVNLQPCLFDSDVFDPGPVQILALEPFELSELPPKFKYMANDFDECNLLLPATRDLVTMVKEVYTTRIRLDVSNMSAARALETTHWITKRSMAIRNKLLSAFSRSAPDESIEECFLPSPTLGLVQLLDRTVRIALIQFTLLSMNITGRMKTVKIMAQFLKQYLTTLSRMDAAYTGISQKLIFWLLVIGYSCALSTSDTEGWFREQCLAAVDAVKEDCEGLLQDTESEVDTLEQLQAGYFFHTSVQTPRLKRLIGVI